MEEKMYVCEYCGGTFDPDYLIYHHESYLPEIKVLICRKCHAITHSKPNSPSRKRFLETHPFWRPGGKRPRLNRLDPKYVRAWKKWIDLGGRSLKKFRDAYLEHPEWGDEIKP